MRGQTKKEREWNERCRPRGHSLVNSARKDQKKEKKKKIENEKEKEKK